MNNNPNKSRGIIALIVGLLIIGIAVIVYFAVNNESDNEDAAQTNTNTSEQVEQDESQLEQIVESPATFVGETVTINGEVQDVLSQRAFKIAEQAAGEELLVVFPEALSEERAVQAERFLVDNANTQVTGVIRVATFAEYERDYGLLFDEPGIEAEFENMPVLVATNVQFTDESGTEFDYTFDVDVDATIDADVN